MNIHDHSSGSQGLEIWSIYVYMHAKHFSPNCTSISISEVSSCFKTHAPSTNSWHHYPWQPEKSHACRPSPSVEVARTRHMPPRNIQALAHHHHTPFLCQWLVYGPGSSALFQHAMSNWHGSSSCQHCRATPSPAQGHAMSCTPNQASL